MRLRKGRDPAASAFLYWSARFQERKRGMDRAVLSSPCRPPPPIPADTCTSLFIMSTSVRQSRVSFVGEGEGQAGMTRRTYRWPTDLYILAVALRWFSRPRANFVNEISYFPTCPLPGRSVNKQESSEFCVNLCRFLFPCKILIFFYFILIETSSVAGSQNVFILVGFHCNSACN